MARTNALSESEKRFPSILLGLLGNLMIAAATTSSIPSWLICFGGLWAAECAVVIAVFKMLDPLFEALDNAGIQPLPRRQRP